MKRLFTFFTAMLLVVMASAQEDETFQFVDAGGNVIANGATITITQVNDEGQMVVPVCLKNASGAKAAAAIYEDIDAMPNGQWQTCAIGNCIQLAASGYSAKSVVDADYNADIQTEWTPQAGKYATWEAKLQIQVFDVVARSQFGTVIETAGSKVIGYGPAITVRFEYSEPEPQPETCDVNGDGTVDVADISSIISVMAGTSSADADVNGDGTVDVADISTVITRMANMARMN